MEHHRRHCVASGMLSRYYAAHTKTLRCTGVHVHDAVLLGAYVMPFLSLYFKLLAYT